MDAVGRHYTDERTLVGLNAQILKANETIEERLQCSIKTTIEIENFSSDFENSLSVLLGADSRERMLFYLIEYAMWYEEYTKSCKVLKHTLGGKNTKAIKVFYSLHINEKYKLFIYIFKSNKETG